MHFYMVMLMKKSIWSNFLVLSLRESCLICRFIVYMALSNYPVHGLGILRVPSISLKSLKVGILRVSSSISLKSFKVMLIFLCFIIIVPKDVSISLYTWTTLLPLAAMTRVLYNWVKFIVLTIFSKLIKHFVVSETYSLSSTSLFFQ